MLGPVRFTGPRWTLDILGRFGSRSIVMSPKSTRSPEDTFKRQARFEHWHRQQRRRRGRPREVPREIARPRARSSQRAASRVEPVNAHSTLVPDRGALFKNEITCPVTTAAGSRTIVPFRLAWLRRERQQSRQSTRALLQTKVFVVHSARRHTPLPNRLGCRSVLVRARKRDRNAARKSRYRQAPVQPRPQKPSAATLFVLDQQGDRSWTRRWGRHRSRTHCGIRPPLERHRVPIWHRRTSLIFSCPKLKQ